MASFHIFRLKESASQQFRWQPHVSGNTPAKRKDYEEDGSIEAENVYAAWIDLREAERPLRVGDILEDPNGRLAICKYVGFEVAEWILPPVKTGLEDVPPASGPAPIPETAEAR